MPIKTSAKKALRQSQKRHAENKIIKRELKKTLKNLKDAVDSNQPEKAKELVPLVYKKIDKAAKRGLIKKNTASRKKSRMSRLISGKTSRGSTIS